MTWKYGKSSDAKCSVEKYTAMKLVEIVVGQGVGKVKDIINHP